MTIANHRESAKLISIYQLTRQLNQVGHLNVGITENNNDGAIGQGRLSFTNINDDMMVHICEMTETQNARNSSMVNECLSLVFLLKGSVNFALNDVFYNFDASLQPVCFANILPNHTKFCRYLKQGVQVTKLNITLSRRWLTQRCSTMTERQTIDRFFSQAPEVRPLNVSAWLMQQVELVMQQDLSPSLHNNVFAECAVLQIASVILNQLLAPAPQQNVDQCTPPSLTMTCEIEQIVNTLIKRERNNANISLTDLAQQIGTSVSTLQRRFKQRHQATIQEYIRAKKLEMAKHALLVSQKSLGEIAYDAGYNHVSNFSNAFKKQYGCSPTELRTN